MRASGSMFGKRLAFDVTRTGETIRLTNALSKETYAILTLRTASWTPDRWPDWTAEKVQGRNFYSLDDSTLETALRLISRIPNRKLIMLDRWLEQYPGNYGAVYQDFENDVCIGLAEGLDELKAAGTLNVLTLPESLYGPLIHKGLLRFAKQNSLKLKFSFTTPEEICPGDIFLVLNSQLDWGLAALARKASEQGLTIGKDIKIISYNDFELNEVVLGGLTTISTDFAKMGRLAADMILSGELSKIHCDFRMNRRLTF